MKQFKTLITLSILFLTLTFQSCQHGLDYYDCVEGEGSLSSETFDLKDFQGVNLMVDATIHLSQGPNQSILVEAQDNVLDEMNLKVRRGILEIDFDHCIRDERRIDIFITMPDIESLKIQGSGAIFGDNTIDTKDISLVISGSGDMDLDIEADLIEGKISGSGDIFLSGNADELDYKISGSGDLDAFNLEVEDAFMKITGSGDMELFVTDFLEVNISGSGDVKFIGHPRLDIHISGSGDVIDVN